MFGGISHKIASRKQSSYTGGGTVENSVYCFGYVTGSRTNTYTLPLGCKVNDILVYWGSGPVAASSFQTPSGWSNLLSRGYSGTIPGCKFMMRRLQSGFSSTLTIGDARFSTVIGVFRNVSIYTTPPVDGANQAQSSGNSAQPDPPAYTTTTGVGTALVACVCKVGEQSKSNIVAPSGYTLIAAEDGTGESRTETVAMSFRMLSASGSQNPGAYSGFSSASAWWLGECTSLKLA